MTAKPDDEQSDVKASALALLRRWRAERPGARLDAETLGPLEVERLGPRQLVLTSVYEARGVKYALKAAASRPSVQEDGPEPWAAELPHPEGFPVGSDVNKHLPDRRVQMDCGRCSGMGDVTCPSCGGDGRGGGKDSSGRSLPCGGCGGRGEVRCGQCSGSGGLVGTPTLWSRIQEHAEARVEKAPELPLSVLTDLLDGDDGGEVEHVREGPRLEGLLQQGGYRDAGRSDVALTRLAASLCGDPNVPPRARIHRQRLEVLRVPVFRVSHGSGKEFFVYGDPPRVVPARALETVRAKAIRALPWIALATLLVGLAVAGWVSR